MNLLYVLVKSTSCTSISSLENRGATAPALTGTTWPHRWVLIYIFVILTIEDDLVS